MSRIPILSLTLTYNAKDITKSTIKTNLLTEYITDFMQDWLICHSYRIKSKGIIKDRSKYHIRIYVNRNEHFFRYTSDTGNDMLTRGIVRRMMQHIDKIKIL